MTWISPRERAGFRIFAAFIEPSASPAPTRLWTSSMTRMILPSFFDLVDEAFHAAFKLTSKLRACNERGQIHQIDFLALELVGHLLIDNPLR